VRPEIFRRDFGAAHFVAVDHLRVGPLLDVEDAQAERFDAAPVRAQRPVANAAIFFRRAHDDCARAVTEERRDGAPARREVERGGVRLGADEEHVLEPAGAHHRRRGRETVDEAGALIANVHRGHELRVVAIEHAELALQEAAAPGEMNLRRERAEQNHVDVFGRDAGVLDRLLARGHGEVGRADALVGVVTLLDARSLHDPIVRRVDAVLLAKVVVGHDTRREVATSPRNVCVGHCSQGVTTASRASQ